jgi:hypothetical protein
VLAALGAALAMTGCSRNDQATPAPVAEPSVVVVDSRIVEGADLCTLATAEELEWLLGERLTRRPLPDPVDPSACSASFTATTVSLAGRTSASGVRAVVAGNTAFADAGATGCQVSVALLPGSTERAGSYLSVGVVRARADRSRDCRTAGRVADYLLRQLPRH